MRPVGSVAAAACRGGPFGEVIPIELDRLTGLLLKAAFEARLAREIPRSSRYARPFTLMLAEVDFSWFEKERDLRTAMSYRIFKQLGPLILKRLRTVDFAGRISGELFAILLPETGLSGAFMAGERLCRAIEAHAFMGEDLDERVRVALNVGAASFPEHGLSGEELLSSAHKALLIARRDGGNRAVVFPEILYPPGKVFRKLSPQASVQSAATVSDSSEAPGQDSSSIR